MTDYKVGDLVRLKPFSPVMCINSARIEWQDGDATGHYYSVMYYHHYKGICRDTIPEELLVPVESGVQLSPELGG